MRTARLLLCSGMAAGAIAMSGCAPRETIPLVSWSIAGADADTVLSANATDLLASSEQILVRMGHSRGLSRWLAADLPLTSPAEDPPSARPVPAAWLGPRDAREVLLPSVEDDNAIVSAGAVIAEDGRKHPHNRLPHDAGILDGRPAWTHFSTAPIGGYPLVLHVLGEEGPRAVTPEESSTTDPEVGVQAADLLVSNALRFGYDPGADRWAYLSIKQITMVEDGVVTRIIPTTDPEGTLRRYTDLAICEGQLYGISEPMGKEDRPRAAGLEHLERAAEFELVDSVAVRIGDDGSVTPLVPHAHAIACAGSTLAALVGDARSVAGVAVLPIETGED